MAKGSRGGKRAAQATGSLSLERLQEIIDEGDYMYYGLRTDDKAYNVGDEVDPSHEWFQDQDYDIDGNEIYPYVIERGMYDAGELPGTSSIETNGDDLKKKLEHMKVYPARYTYLIAGQEASPGYDNYESIITDAVVLAVIKRNY